MASRMPTSSACSRGLLTVRWPRRLAPAHGLRPPAVPVRRRVLPDHVQGHRQVRHRVHTGPVHHADLRDLSADHLELLPRRCLDRTTFGKPVPLPNLGELRGGPPSTSVGNFFVRRHGSLPTLLASWAIGNLVKATTFSRAQDCLEWAWPVACRAAKECDNKCPRTCNGCQKSPEIPTDLIPTEHCVPQARAGHSTVTDLARLRGLWFRPALRALTWLRQVSLHRKPSNLARLRRWRCAPPARNRHSTVTLLAKFLGLSTSVPRAHAVWYASNCSGTTCRIGDSAP